MSQEEQDELAILSNKKGEELKVLEFQYGARSVISNYTEAYNYLVNAFNPETIIQIHDFGKSIYKYLCQDAKQSYKNGFEIEFRCPEAFIPIQKQTTNSVPSKLYFICINKERFNPINFGIDYHKDGYDGCACFYFDGKQYNFSLYNDNGLVDVSLIAKQFGGGGHKGAAGFRVKNLNDIIK